jgi:hypothetical protein
MEPGIEFSSPPAERKEGEAFPIALLSQQFQFLPLIIELLQKIESGDEREVTRVVRSPSRVRVFFICF